jgi:hypothetical protein
MEHCSRSINEEQEGANSAAALTPRLVNRPVTIAKIISVVQKREQKVAAMKDARKNHFFMQLPPR